MEHNNNMPQLFINFRGKDERLKLLPNLKHHLKGSKVTVFTDDDATGEPLENLFKYIRKSRIVIVIFSINYLESGWCLDELVEIRRCLMTEKLDFAIPIFYNVKASHVKYQTGDFGEKFLALRTKFPQSIKKWTKALTYVANFGGLSYDKNGSITELDFFKRIVERVDILLTKITSKEGHNNQNNNQSLVSTKTSHGEAANLIKFDNDDINRLYHFSKALEALDLQRRNLEDYNRGVYLKHMSHNYPPYIEEPSWTWDHNVPQDWHHLDYGRTNSFPDNIYQIYPPPYETPEVQNHQFVAQVSNDNFLQDDTTVVQNHPVVNQVSIDTNLHNKTIEDQNPVLNQSSIDNNLQRKSSEKPEEDICCWEFMGYCFKPSLCCT